MAYFKTRKGRGYLKYDNASHGAPHKMNSDLFWETKKEFAEKYGVQFAGFGEPAPSNPEDFRQQTKTNIDKVISVLREDQALVNYLADTIVQLGESVPDDLPGFKMKDRNPFHDPRIFDFQNYPPELFAKPGEKVPNRAAFANLVPGSMPWGLRIMGALFYRLLG